MPRRRRDPGFIAKFKAGCVVGAGREILVKRVDPAAPVPVIIVQVIAARQQGRGGREAYRQDRGPVAPDEFRDTVEGGRRLCGNRPPFLVSGKVLSELAGGAVSAVTLRADRLENDRLQLPVDVPGPALESPRRVVFKAFQVDQDVAGGLEMLKAGHQFIEYSADAVDVRPFIQVPFRHCLFG